MDYLRHLLVAIAPIIVLCAIGQFDHRACGADSDTPRGDQKPKPILIPWDLLMTDPEGDGSSSHPRTGSIDVTDSAKYKSVAITLIPRKSGSKIVDERWKQVKYDPKVFTIVFANDKLAQLGIAKIDLVESISKWRSKEISLFEVFTYELKVPGGSPVPLYSVGDIVINYKRSADDKR